MRGGVMTILFCLLGLILYLSLLCLLAWVVGFNELGARGAAADGQEQAAGRDALRGSGLPGGHRRVPG